MITVNTFSRMFRTIPRLERHEETQSKEFMNCIKDAAGIKNRLCDIDTGMDVGKYRQIIAERIQDMPYHSSNDLDTTLINISDTGIERMMNDSEYESWVMKQINSVFTCNDPFRELSGGKLNIIRVGAIEKDFIITTERVGFPNGQDSMIPKVHEEDDDGFWIRREKRFEEQMEMIKR